jgi:hypothetical protein
VKQVIPKNPSAATGKRFRILVNDGQHTCSFMVATQMATVLDARPQDYCRGAILQCNEIIANDVNNRRCALACHGLLLQRAAAMCGSVTAASRMPECWVSCRSRSAQQSLHSSLPTTAGSSSPSTSRS